MFASDCLAANYTRRTLRIGTDATYPPFETVNVRSGELEGFDIDFGKELGRILDRKVEFVVVPFDSIIQGLKQKKYTAIISAMTITRPRQKEISFSDPYYSAGQTIVVHKSNTRVKGLQELMGKRIGVQLGTTGELEAKKIPKAEVIVFDNIGSAFIDLENKHLDAVINDHPTNLILVAKRPALRIVSQLLTSESYGVGLRKDDQVLLHDVNLALQELRTSGKLKELEEKWKIISPDENLNADSVVVREIKRLWVIMVFLLPAIPMTLYITTISFVLALFLGICVGLLRVSSVAWVRKLSRMFVDTVRGVPLLVLIFFIYFGLGKILNLNQFAAGIIAISVCYSAFLGEIIRSGIEAVPKGQTDAARSLGMTAPQTMRYVIFPQSVRIVLPPIANEFISCLKDSSLVSIIGLRDLTRAGREMYSQTFLDFQTWFLVGFIYLCLTYVLTKAFHKLEARLQVGNRY